jgi:hypothetical protein
MNETLTKQNKLKRNQYETYTIRYRFRFENDTYYKTRTKYKRFPQSNRSRFTKNAKRYKVNRSNFTKNVKRVLNRSENVHASYALRV